MRDLKAMIASDIQLKLERARAHIDEFRKKASNIRDGYCVIKPEEDQERKMTVMRINITPKAPDELRLIAGDALFNMRAALDYVVTHAVLSNPPHAPSRSNQFPITQDAKSFRQIESRQLAGVSDEVRVILERLQPYHRGNEPLGILSKLHNPDKHRQLNLTAVVADSSHLQAIGGASAFSLVSDIPLCDGGVFGNIGIPWDLPAEFASVRTKSMNLRMEGECTQFVGFSDLFDPDEEEEGFEPAEDTLESILKYVERKVLPAVLPHLK
jgi:hypothetical protein